MESIKPLLLDFLQAGDDFKRILVVESLAYLPGLRERFPAAEIHAVAADEEMAEQTRATISEFLDLPFGEEGKSIREVASEMKDCKDMITLRNTIFKE